MSTFNFLLFLFYYCYSINVAPEFDFLSLDSKISLNVGGHIFETTVEILTRDPNSILASICRKSPPVAIGVDFNTYYFDRDWWLFRHILIYLKSNILPNELETLKELHTEASFFRLESLQKAIEDIPLSQISDKEPPHFIST